MLNFRNTNIAFLLLLVLLCLLHFNNYPFPFFVYVTVVLVYNLTLFYGSYFVGSNFFLHTICKANTHEKKIAISFDDGPSEAYTQQVLQVLKQYNVPAAFFCIGCKIKGNESIVKAIHQEGHIIGNHSFSHHVLFDFFLAKKMLADLRQMDIALQKIIPLKPLFFRPPYGVTTPPMRKALAKGNYTAIGWNIRSMDTVIKNENKLFERVGRQLKPGAILLFHDTCKPALVALPLIIQYAVQNGYEFVRLDELINKEAYTTASLN